MNGIIYKMTILEGCDIFGHNPYYVGQHWGVSIDNYFGSGVIWNKCILKIKKLYGESWKIYIKKEILFSGNVTQRTLNTLEKFYIRKHASLYEFNKGGCNVSIGGDNTCPSKSAIAREKIRLSHLGVNNPIHKHVYTDIERESMRKRKIGNKMSEESKKKLSEARLGMKFTDDHCKNISKAMIGDKNPNYGKRGNETSMYGRQQTEYQKSVLRERMKGKNNPMYGKVSPNKGKKMSEEQKRKISESNKRTYAERNNIG